MKDVMPLSKQSLYMIDRAKYYENKPEAKPKEKNT